MSALEQVFVAFAHVEAPADAPNEDCLGVYTTLERAQARVVLCCVEVDSPGFEWQQGRRWRVVLLV